MHEYSRYYFIFLDEEGVLNTSISTEEENESNLEPDSSLTEIDWTKIFPEKRNFQRK